jgi:hypothetical protein
MLEKGMRLYGSGDPGLKNATPLTCLSLFFASFILYIYTISPGWGPVNIFNTWDGLEYLLCSNLLGIDHPPGHPLYLTAAKIFCSLVPLGAIAFRMNLFSAFFGALTVGTVYLIVELVLGLTAKPKDETLRRVVSVAAAAMLAVSRVFWTHSLLTEVHTLYLFLMSLSFYFAIRFLSGKNIRYAYLTALSLGLMVSTSVFNAVTVAAPFLIFFSALLLYDGSIRPKIREFLTLFLCFAAGVAFYVYYPVVNLLGPAFVHPMNLTSGESPGSIGWFIWYVSGRAWTGQGMFSIGRVFLNLPNFLMHAIDNYSVLSAVLVLAALAYSGSAIHKDLSSPLKKGTTVSAYVLSLSASSRTFILLILSLIFVVVPQLSLQDVSNPGSSTYIYLANFFLPSFLIHVLLIGIGLGAVVAYLEEKDLIFRFYRLFAGKVVVPEFNRRAIILVMCSCIFALPMALMARNYTACDLRGENTGYEFAKGVFENIPARSVLYSKLVYQSVALYFDRIEPIIAGKEITIREPDILIRSVVAGANSPTEALIAKTEFLKDSMKRDLAGSHRVFICGDSIDQDKAPEALLMSDLELAPLVPRSLLLKMTGPYPTELIPYEVKGFLRAAAFRGKPDIEGRGVSNDGDFAGVLELLGYRTVQGNVPVGRNKIGIDLYWTVLNPVPEDLAGLVAVFDQQLRRVDPLRTTGFFTLGGEEPSSHWAKGRTMKERIYYYLPQLPPGNYFLALGLLRRNDQSVPYFPKDHEKYSRQFDFVLLMPFGIGQPAAYPRAE